LSDSDPPRSAGVDSTQLPLISVVMANFNGERYIAEAVKSATTQTWQNVEIIIVDDGSTDRSIAIVQDLRAQDDRIKLITSLTRRGPAASRNIALKAARGEWIAIVDSDDLMHPSRLQFLLNSAIRDGADIVADDLLVFDANYGSLPRSMLGKRETPFWLNASQYLRANHLFGRPPALGYLKPVYRASYAGRLGIVYDEHLNIAEDFDFLLRLLLAGAKFRVYPELLYFYRRHPASISNRLNVGALEAMAVANQNLIKQLEGSGNRDPAFRVREKSIDNALAFQRMADALKIGQLVNFFRLATKRPQALPLFRFSLLAKLRSVLSRSVQKVEQQSVRHVCVLTRQRIIGPTNGSSKYLLELMSTLVQHGIKVHLLSPSPTTLGRWPYLRLSPEMAIFASVRVRGTLRIGSVLVALDPRLFFKGALAILEKLLLQLKLISVPIFEKAPYAMAAALSKPDQLFLARHVPAIGDALIADYCFLTETFPYTLRADAPTFVIMHDLFSSRAAQFEDVSSTDSVTAISEYRELELLARAGTIVAIQNDEAAFLRRKLPTNRIITSPLAALPSAYAQAGSNDSVLFVGSSAAPNVDGLRWFLDSCWPLVKRVRPAARLNVVGTVCHNFWAVPEGVVLFGQINSLVHAYRDAGVVISPLRAGSGLKVKLIEGLAHGKAMVVTSTTIQGVGDLLGKCCLISDDPAEFTAAIIRLLDRETERIELGERGIAAIREHFSPDRCYGPFVDILKAELRIAGADHS
jgi:glycosyltransferase involved in cell wall biosynthesis